MISFFDSGEAAAEERFEQMGDEVAESVRGKRERQRTTVSPVASAEALM
ncbi:MAG: hypothetical protein ACXVII_30040 [Solirubrobacteraceae bacterium]